MFILVEKTEADGKELCRIIFKKKIYKKVKRRNSKTEWDAIYWWISGPVSIAVRIPVPTLTIFALPSNTKQI